MYLCVELLCSWFRHNYPSNCTFCEWTLFIDCVRFPNFYTQFYLFQRWKADWWNSRKWRRFTDLIGFMWREATKMRTSIPSNGCSSFPSPSIIYIYIYMCVCVCVTTHNATSCLTLILLTWRIWWAPNNVSKWQMGLNSAFKELSSFLPHVQRAFFTARISPPN